MKSVTFIAAISMMGWCESLDGCAPVYSETTGGTASSTASTGDSGATSVPTGTAPTGTTAPTGEASTDPTGEASTVSTDTMSTGSTSAVSVSTDTASTSSMSEASTTTGDTTTMSTGEASTASTGEPLPDAPVLNLTFSSVKAFNFSWAAAGGAQYYQLLESPTGDANYAQIGGDIVGEKLSLTMPLHLRFGARYVLRGCNGGGCTDSDEVEVVDSMADAIGYFKASNAGALDQFGASIAISADGNTLAVGAAYESGVDNTLTNSGTVYVFVRVNNVWSEQSILRASNKGAGDGFGHDVTISADGNTLAVGAFREDSPAVGIGGSKGDNLPMAEDSGAAYVFVRVGNVWTEQAYIKASNTGLMDRFGHTVAVSGDGNTLAVGAYWEDSNAVGINGAEKNELIKDSGAVYVFVRSVDVWTQQAYVKASNTGTDDHFGDSVTVSADGNTLAVGAAGENSGVPGINVNPNVSATNAGALYVFVRVNNAWSQQAYIKPSNTEIGDQFGLAAAMAADGNTLVVGAPEEDSAAKGIDGDEASKSAQNSGALYVFVRSKETWTQQAYVKASNTGAGDLFGRSTGLSADGNILAVGAYMEDSAAKGMGGDQGSSGAQDSGAVYVLTRSGTLWSQRAYVKASNAEATDAFFSSVTMTADGSTLVVGAFQEDGAKFGIGGDQSSNTAMNAGAVYVF